MSRNSETHILPKRATWGEALAWGVERLRASAIGDTPDLDAQTLLAHTLGVSRATLLAYPERKLASEQAATFANLVERRLAHEPVAYLVGHREFMGLDFAVDRRALIPRPETELLVEAALADLRARLEQSRANGLGGGCRNRVRRDRALAGAIGATGGADLRARHLDRCA